MHVAAVLDHIEIIKMLVANADVYNTDAVRYDACLLLVELHRPPGFVSLLQLQLLELLLPYVWQAERETGVPYCCFS